MCHGPNLIAYARSRGIKELWGSVARGNGRMLDLAHELGFTTEPDSHPTLVRSVLDLAP